MRENLSGLLQSLMPTLKQTLQQPLTQAVVALAVLVGTSPASAAICSKRNSPKKIANLDATILPESSGLAASQLFPQRLYHVNDSGDGSFFYVSDEEGGHLDKVEIENFTAHDVEDLAVGACGEQNCIFIADIGDNKRERSTIDLVLIAESAGFKNSVKPLHHLTLRYPDRPHDAEAIVVHPNGDIYIFTKEFSKEDRKAEPAMVFRLDKEDLFATSTETLKKVGAIDLPWLNFEYGLWGQVITSAAISEDGKSLAILTYDAIIDFNLENLNGVDLPDVRSLEAGKDYLITDLLRLTLQQEAVTFRPGTQTLLFTSETADSGVAPLYKIDCEGGSRTGYAAAAEYMRTGEKRHRSKKRSSKSAKRR